MALGDDAPRERRPPNKATNTVFMRYCLGCQHMTFNIDCMWCEEDIHTIVVRDEVYTNAYRIYDLKNRRWLGPEEIE